MSNCEKLVRGTGVKGNKYPSSISRKHVKEYKLWESMLDRCTDKWKIKSPTYAGVTCSENFKSYTFFYEWCQEQVGFGNIDSKGIFWHLDKDILVRGNKLYSEDTCVFIPQRINNLILKVDKRRGDYPLGVFFREDRNKFMASCKPKGYLGLFETEEDAFQAYKQYKESFIRSVAFEYERQIDVRAYKSLIDYKVEFDD